MLPAGRNTHPHRCGLLVTDLDGTLAVNGRIGIQEQAAAHLLRRAGIPLLVITGRNPRSLRRVRELWSIADEVLFASGAGRLVSADAEPEERHRLNVEETLRITTILDDFREDYCVLHPIPHSHHFSWRRYRSPELNTDFDARMSIYEEWAAPWTGAGSLEGGACQILVIRPPGAAPDAALEEALSPWSVFHSSSPIDHRSMWLEVFPAGVDKGSALAEWCGERGLESRDVLSLGNDYNDRSMLNWSAHSRVVGNAPDELKVHYATLPPAGEGGFEAAVDLAINLFGEESQ